MKIKSVDILPLKGKYYSTEMIVHIQDNPSVLISLATSYERKPSLREIERGWEKEEGMDHTEGENTYKIALLILSFLENLKEN